MSITVMNAVESACQHMHMKQNSSFNSLFQFVLSCQCSPDVWKSVSQKVELYVSCSEFILAVKAV